MAEYYAGIDLGARSSWLCVVDAAGRKQLSRRVRNEAVRILNLLDPFRASLQAVVESTFNWYWIVDLLQDHEIDVKLAHRLVTAHETSLPQFCQPGAPSSCATGEELARPRGKRCAEVCGARTHQGRLMIR